MPRIANDTKALLADLKTRLERLVETARKEGRAEALAEVRQLVGGGGGTGTSRKPAKRRKKRKTWWDTATEKQKAERIRKMQAGRGLKPKAKRKAAKKSKPRKKSTRRKPGKPTRKRARKKTVAK